MFSTGFDRKVRIEIEVSLNQLAVVAEDLRKGMSTQIDWYGVQLIFKPGDQAFHADRLEDWIKKFVDAVRKMEREELSSPDAFIDAKKEVYKLIRSYRKFK